MSIKRYSELMLLPTFKERYEYLREGGVVGSDTFGFDRYLNQIFYHTKEWKRIRDEVIFRDSGRDLGVHGHEIFGPIYIHHMNPIDANDIVNRSETLLVPEFLICCSYKTHLAIHYGDETLLQNEPIERKPNDTCPWRK